MNAVDKLVARASQILDQLPDDQLAGASPLTDAIETLDNSTLESTAKATVVVASAGATPAIRAKAARVYNVAKQVIAHRKEVGKQLAEDRPYPEVFAKSPSGQKLTAVVARRVRLGTENGGGRDWGGNSPTRRPTGPLTYYRTWVNQGRWGRSGGSSSPTRIGTGSDPIGLGGAGEHRFASVSGDLGALRDGIEAAIMGRAFDKDESIGLAGLNIGKFLKNAFKDFSPLISLATPFVPGLDQIGNIVGQQQQQPQQYAAPVYGPAPQQPAAESPKVPVWVWGVGGAAALGVVALALRK